MKSYALLAIIVIAFGSMALAQDDCSGKTLKSDTTLKIGNRNVIVQFPTGFGNKPAPLLLIIIQLWVVQHNGKVIHS